MAIGLSILLIAIGAVLTWGVSFDVSGVSVNVVGIILMVVGAVGLLVSMIVFGSGRRTVVREEY